MVPLLVAIAPAPAKSIVPARVRSGRRAFALGLACGSTYFAGTLYWITGVMRVYGDLNAVVAGLVNLALVAYLAIYPALFTLVVWQFGRRLGSRALLLAPVVWIATEYGRGWLLGGFPWVLLGYSQATVLPVVQVASLVGIYGLSGLVAGVNGTVAFAVFANWRERLVSCGVALAIVGLVAAWGSWRLAEGSLARSGVPLRVGLIQGNIAQGEKWDRDRALRNFQTHLDLSRTAAERGAQLIIWPESATPFYFEEDPVSGARIRQLAVETRTYILFGSDEVERGTPPRYYNSAFLVGPDGSTLARYRKIHLVPFGEFVPLKSLLFFASRLVEAVSDFSPGDEPVVLPVGVHRASTAICYEVVYPDLIRRFVGAGSHLLTTITNDAWYGHSSAPFQHFEQASVRAIEQGRYLARAANTGISGIVDPYGRVTLRSELFERIALVGEVRVLEGRTLYSRIGDLIAWLALGWTMLLAIAIWRADVNGGRLSRTFQRSR